MIFKTGIEKQKEPTLITIGNFDGFHRGHRFLIEECSRRAAEKRLKLIVITFTPHPRIFFGHRLELISTDQQRIENLLQTNISGELYFLSFSSVRELSAIDFLERILIEQMNCRMLVVGTDFRLGAGRCCDTRCLQKLAEKLGLAIELLPSYKVGSLPVSSSLVRKILKKGEIDLANRLLVKPYFIDGVIIEGKRVGHQLGFPTANLKAFNQILPPGVFISRLRLDGINYQALTNIGFNPTFGYSEKRVETFIFNFNQNIYGRKVRLFLLKKLREEKRFNSPQELGGQIREDVLIANRLIETFV